MQSTQSTPAGCFVGSLALFPMVVSGLGLFGLYRWWHLPIEQRVLDHRFWMLVAAVILGALAAIGLLFAARRILGATDFRGYDSRDRGEPPLKF